MGLGILEPRSGKHVAGTVKLIDEDLRSIESGAEEGIRIPAARHRLKHAKGKNTNVVLVPQPSDSPNDPLSWPLWKRDLALLTLCLAGALTAILGPAISPINRVLVKEFNVSFHEVSTWSGWQFWPAGIAGLVSSSAGRIWGKRPVYIVSAILAFAGSIWNGCATSPGSFLGSRILQGFGQGAYEMLVPASIGDMYFVHERGKRIAFYNLTFLGTTYFMPVLGGYISMKHGWRTQFAIISAFLGPAVLLLIAFCPEHAFNRSASLNTDTSSEVDLNQVDERLDSEKEKEVAKETTTESSTAAEGSPTTPSVAPLPQDEKKTWMQELRIYNGRFSDESFLKGLLSPFVVMTYPATIWAFLFQGTFITWGIAVAIMLAQLFSGPPNNFGPEQIGYIYTAPAIGALAGYFLAGLFSDSIAKFMAKRNSRIYEPEFRILLVIPTAIFAIPGLFAFGVAADAHIHWIGPSVCYGMLTFAIVISCTATSSYALDAHRDIAVEMMVAVLVLKNFFAFGSTFFLSNWLRDWGATKMFFVIGGIQTGVMLLSLPMYLYGKRQRAMIKRVNPLKKLGLYPSAPMAAVAH